MMSDFKGLFVLGLFALVLFFLSPASHASIVDFGSETVFTAAPITQTVTATDGSMADIRFTFNLGTTDSGGTLEQAALSNSLADSPFNASNVVSWSLTGETLFMRNQTHSITLDIFDVGTTNPITGDVQMLFFTNFSMPNAVTLDTTDGTFQGLSGSPTWNNLGTNSVSFDGAFNGFNNTAPPNNIALIGGSNLTFAAPTYGTFGSSSHGFQINPLSFSTFSIPEPSTFLTLSSLMMLYAFPRRRK